MHVITYRVPLSHIFFFGYAMACFSTISNYCFSQIWCGQIELKSKDLLNNDTFHAFTSRDRILINIDLLRFSATIDVLSVNSLIEQTFVFVLQKCRLIRNDIDMTWPMDCIELFCFSNARCASPHHLVIYRVYRLSLSTGENQWTTINIYIQYMSTIYEVYIYVYPIDK